MDALQAERKIPPAVAYVKMDIEGSECLALQGGDAVFRSQPPLIQAEVRRAFDCAAYHA